MTFLPVHANGTPDISGGLPLSTGYIEPPEICFFSVLSTKMHSYMYAKNLYQYLTRCTCDDFYIDPHNQHRGTKEVADLNFNLPVFKTDRGKLLEPLIKEMMQTNPAARPSLMK